MINCSGESVNTLKRIMLIHVRHVRLESVKSSLVNLELVVVIIVNNIGGSTLLSVLSPSPSPPSPSNIQVLKRLGYVVNVLESSIARSDSIDCVQLVHEDRHVIFVSEANNEFVEVVDMPLLVEVNLKVSITVRAALRNPSLIQVSTAVLSWVSSDTIVEHILIWVEVVESIDNI